MRVGVEEASFEKLHQIARDTDVDQPVDLGSLSIDKSSTIDPLHDKNLPTRQAENWSWGCYLPKWLHESDEFETIFGFLDIVHLFIEPSGPLIENKWQIRPYPGRILQEVCQLPQQAQVEGDDIEDAWSLNLDGHLFAIFEFCLVDLSDGGRGDWHFTYFFECLIEVLAQLLSEYSFGDLIRESRHIVTKLLELIHHILRKDIGPDGDGLPNLDESRTQSNEELPALDRFIPEREVLPDGLGV